MNLIPLLALTQKPDTSVMDALPHSVGMLMVFATLAILWGLCALSAKLIQLFLPEPALKPATIKPTPLPVVQSGVEDAGTPPEIIAAIAAAVACFTGPSHRIVSIRRQSTSWEKAGRQSVLTSHKIR